MSAQITRGVEVDAGEQRVWDVLTDFDRYEDWNPFMIRAAGRAAAGNRLTITMRPEGGRGVRMRPRVLEAEPGRRLRWLGRLGVPGLFDGEHVFTIEPLGPGRVRLVNHERFRGVLVPLLRGVIARTEVGFDQMNHALKERAESRERAS